MKKSDVEAPTSLEYLYKEYVRLSERCASYVQSSFDDFKLYGASGLVFALKPILDSSQFSESTKNLMLFYGFLTILLVTMILAIAHMVKQSLVVYYLQYLRAYESRIKAELGLTDEATFQWAEDYSKWRRKVVAPIFIHLLIVLIFTVILFPTVILIFQEPRWYAVRYAVIYLSVSVLLVGIYISAARRLLHRATSNLSAT